MLDRSPRRSVSNFRDRFGGGSVNIAVIGKNRHVPLPFKKAMAFSICPLCGEAMHGLPDMNDLAAWYAKNHPDLPVGSVITYSCMDCTHEYAIGESVISRDREDPNVYAISSIVRRENQPPLLIVNTPNGVRRTLAVTQIRPVKEWESETAKPVNGYF